MKLSLRRIVRNKYRIDPPDDEHADCANDDRLATQPEKYTEPFMRMQARRAKNHGEQKDAVDRHKKYE